MAFDEKRGTREDRNSVSVRKSVSATGTGALVEYELSVERETEIVVRVVDEVPEEGEITRFRGDVHYYEIAEASIEFYATVASGSATCVSVLFSGPSADLERLESAPRIDQIRSLPTAGRPSMSSDADLWTPATVSVAADASERADAPDRPFTEGGGDRPAVGVVASRSNGDSLVHTVVRSRTNGYAVIVGDRGDADADVLRLCERFGATTTRLPSAGDELDFRRSLSTAARERSLPGIVFHEDLGRRIDFRRSLEGFEEAAEPFVDARYEGDADGRNGSASLAVSILARGDAADIGDAVATAKVFADEVFVVVDGDAGGAGNGAAAAGAKVFRTGSDGRYGGAFRRLFEAAVECDIDYLAVFDADGPYDASDLPRFVESQRRADVNVAVGRPSAEGSRSDSVPSRSLGRRVAAALGLAGRDARATPYAAGLPGGVQAYDRRALETLSADESLGDATDVATAVSAHASARGYDVTEVASRDDDATRDDRRRRLERALGIVDRVRLPPALGILGLAGVLSGLGLAYWTLQRSLATGVLPVETAAVAASLAFAGVLACVTAVALRSLGTNR